MNIYMQEADILNTAILNHQDQISEFERSLRQLKRSFIKKHAAYIVGDVIRVCYSVKYKDIDNFPVEVILGITGVDIEVNPMTNKYEICYSTRGANKDSTIRKRSQYVKKYFQSWLESDKVQTSFINHVPR